MAASSPGRTPIPIVQAFVLCREIFRDERTKELILIGPTANFPIPRFPAMLSFQVFLQMTDCQGRYRFALSLRNAADEEVWRWVDPKAFESPNPLAVSQAVLPIQGVRINEPGRYRILFLSNDEEVVSQSVVIGPPRNIKAG